MIATDTSDMHTCKIIVPFIDRQENETLIEAPGIRDSVHQAVVNQIPELRIILLFLLQYGKDGSTAFTHCIFSKFGVDIRVINAFLMSRMFDVDDDFINLVFVIMIKGKIITNRKSTTDINGIERRANLLEFCKDLQCLLEFSPIIKRIPDTGIYKQMQHRHLDSFLPCNFFFLVFY